MPELSYVCFDGPDVTVVLELGAGVPRVLHWGGPLPQGSNLPALALLGRTALQQGGLDQHAPLAILPEPALGTLAQPGVSGHRETQAWPPVFVTTHTDSEQSRARWHGADLQAGLEAWLEVGMDPVTGVMTVDSSVTNTGADAFVLHRLAPALPLPSQVTELMTLPGRWAKEFQAQRHPLTMGSVVSDASVGRTSHESAPTLFAGEPGFRHTSGEVFGLHLAWSGDHTLRAERLTDGSAYLQAAELLQPGELVLSPGETYRAPTLVAAYSAHGLNGVSQSFHAFVRGRPEHPRTERKVVLNTWEAVYFDHDPGSLRVLADRAAEIGIERFVLDDGWFRGRDDDTAGLGDWFVDARKYPDGLGVLVDHVRALGMDFGVWVEPEMVNPDSDLYRAHPEWVLAVHGYEPVLARHQLVLDLGRDVVFEYLFQRIDALLTEYPISYLKWDMNRNHVQAGHDGRVGAHLQTLRLYQLLDAVVRAHPQIEIESCASGGARADLGILRYTRRIWTSDCNDALERQEIQRGFGYVFPPEVMGAHIGPPTSHTTGRVHSLAFRAATAIFGHLGLEWDLRSASEEMLTGAAEVVALYKRLRPLLHTGRVVRGDHPDPAALVHGVVANDGSEAVFAYVQLAASAASLPATVRLPGLDPSRTYHVERLRMPDDQQPQGKAQPPWWDTGVAADGATLSTVGLAFALHRPETASLLHLRVTR